MNTRLLSLAAGSLLAMLCGACAVQPAAPPHIEVPQGWGEESPASAVALTSEWFRGFGSEELDELITSTAHSNWDLQAADARVRQADARARAAGAALLPEVNAGANGVFYAGHSSNGTATETDYAGLLSASYEIDFWGKNRAARLSASAQREASESDRAVLALTTVTGVANTYFQVVALRERLELARQTLQNTKQLLGIIEARRAASLSNPVEVAQQRALVAAGEIRVKEVEQQVAGQEAALATLVGRVPGALTVSPAHLSDFQVPKVSAGLPAQLLRRRPDIFSA